MYSLLDNKLFECHWHSSKLRYLFLLLYIVSLVIIWQLAIGLMWKILIVLVLSVYTVGVFFKHILFLSPNSFIALRKSSKNWLVFNQKCGWQAIQLFPANCVVLSWIVILQFGMEGSKRHFTLCLPIDVMDRNDYRKLKVFLRYSNK